MYCHRSDDWPEPAEIVEEVPIRSCVRRGVAIDLVLDRARENRSQFVFTRIQGGREGTPSANRLNPADLDMQVTGDQGRAAGVLAAASALALD